MADKKREIKVGDEYYWIQRYDYFKMRIVEIKPQAQKDATHIISQIIKDDGTLKEGKYLAYFQSFEYSPHIFTYDFNVVVKTINDRLDSEIDKETQKFNKKIAKLLKLKK